MKVRSQDERASILVWIWFTGFFLSVFTSAGAALGDTSGLIWITSSVLTYVCGAGMILTLFRSL